MQVLDFGGIPVLTFSYSEWLPNALNAPPFEVWFAWHPVRVNKQWRWLCDVKWRYGPIYRTAAFGLFGCKVEYRDCSQEPELLPGVDTYDLLGGSRP